MEKSSSDTAVLDPEPAASEPVQDATPSGWTALRPDVSGGHAHLHFRRYTTEEQRFAELQRARAIVGSEEERFARFEQTEEYKVWSKTRFEYADKIRYFGERKDALDAAKANPMAEGSLETLRECSMDGNAAETVLGAYREAAQNAYDAASRALAKLSDQECNAKFSELLAERESLMAKLVGTIAPLLDELAQNSAALQKAKTPLPRVELLGPRPR